MFGWCVIACCIGSREMCFCAAAWMFFSKQLCSQKFSEVGCERSFWLALCFSGTSQRKLSIYKSLSVFSNTSDRNAVVFKSAPSSRSWGSEKLCHSLVRHLRDLSRSEKEKTEDCEATSVCLIAIRKKAGTIGFLLSRREFKFSLCFLRPTWKRIFCHLKRDRPRQMESRERSKTLNDWCRRTLHYHSLVWSQLGIRPINHSLFCISQVTEKLSLQKKATLDKKKERATSSAGFQALMPGSLAAVRKMVLRDCTCLRVNTGNLLRNMQVRENLESSVQCASFVTSQKQLSSFRLRVRTLIELFLVWKGFDVYSRETIALDSLFVQLESVWYNYECKIFFLGHTQVHKPSVALCWK